MKEEKTCGCNKDTARKDYPGAATDAADRDKTSAELVKEATKELNNNPRNTDDKMP